MNDPTPLPPHPKKNKNHCQQSKRNFCSHHRHQFPLPPLDSQKTKMREASAIICSLLLITLHLSSLLPVADSRKPPSPGKNTSSGLSHSQDGSSFKQGGLGSGGKDMETLDSSGRGLMGRIGSTPPSCVHRCRGCSPCNAIQIPAITDRTTVEYANYEPEGWKCKCGPHFFDP